MKFRFKVAPLPAHWRGNWQQFLDALLDRLEITSDAETFTISDEAPAGNRGPWFKEGTQLFVWNEDTSSYEGIDLSASYTAQVFIGETEPDSDLFKIWLKLSGSTVVGLFTFFESGQVWTAKDLTIAPLSITTAKLHDGAATRDKIRPLAVTDEKLLTVIPIIKWEKGAPGEMVRMGFSGEASDWSEVQKVSPELSVQTEALLHWEHGLPRTPWGVSVYLRCKVADAAGFAVGTEIKIQDCATYFAAGGPPLVFRNSTEVGIQIGLGLQVVNPDDFIFRNITPNHWKIVIYVVNQ